MLSTQQIYTLHVDLSISLLYDCCEVGKLNETERYYEFSGLISAANKALRRAQEKYTRDFGLRSVHVACMLHLLSAPEGLSATELSERCGVDRAQISRVTAELEGAGLICEAAPGSKRRYRGSLTLTEPGREKAAMMNNIVAEKLSAVSGELDEHDVEVFYRVLRAIVERIEDI